MVEGHLALRSVAVSFARCWSTLSLCIRSDVLCNVCVCIWFTIGITGRTWGELCGALRHGAARARKLTHQHWEKGQARARDEELSGPHRGQALLPFPGPRKPFQGPRQGPRQCFQGPAGPSRALGPSCAARPCFSSSGPARRAGRLFVAQPLPFGNISLTIGLGGPALPPIPYVPPVRGVASLVRRAGV